MPLYRFTQKEPFVERAARTGRQSVTQTAVGTALYLFSLLGSVCVLCLCVCVSVWSGLLARPATTTHSEPASGTRR